MGQLERYGLYVLCLVIVLILGVAIWGGDPASATGAGKTQLSTGAPGNAPEPPSTGEPARGADFFAPVQLEPDDLGGIAAVQPSLPPASSAETPALGAPLPAPPPAATGLRTYKVQKGDSFERIARRVLRSPKYVAQIKQLNPDVDERRMHVGTVLKLPSVDADGAGGGRSSKGEAAEAVASGDGWREYVVKPGDSAWTIAKAMYGDASQAAAIMRANRIDDPKKLREKTVLRIPPR